MRAARRCLRAISVAAFGFALASGGCASSSGESEPDYLLDPAAVHFGGSYTNWSVLWWQWALELPATDHPLYDEEDSPNAWRGQVPPVWFLGSKFGSLFDPPPPAQPPPFVRRVTVPSGVALFFPLFNVEWDNDYCVPSDWVDRTAAELATLAYDQVNGTTDIWCEIDGKRILDAPDVAAASRFRAVSGTFTVRMPDDHIAARLCGWPAGRFDVSPAVSDGLWVMLAPMPPGEHTIRAGNTAINFYGELFPTEGGYDITVLPP